MPSPGSYSFGAPTRAGPPVRPWGKAGQERSAGVPAEPQTTTATLPGPAAQLRPPARAQGQLQAGSECARFTCPGLQRQQIQQPELLL